MIPLCDLSSCDYDDKHWTGLICLNHLSLTSSHMTDTTDWFYVHVILFFCFCLISAPSPYLESGDPQFQYSSSVLLPVSSLIQRPVCVLKISVCFLREFVKLLSVYLFNLCLCSTVDFQAGLTKLCNSENLTSWKLLARLKNVGALYCFCPGHE